MNAEAKKKKTPTKKTARAHKTQVKHEPKADKQAAHEHVVPAAKEQPAKKAEAKSANLGRYHYAVGRRKTAMAKVKLYDEGNEFTVNSHKMQEYFPTFDLQRIVLNPLSSLGLDKKMTVVSIVRGGGSHAQAEALRHGISRALVLRNLEDKPVLKKFGFLTRDPRVVERKKPGHRKARRSPQWSKR
jgi:small subunit ribosomal protein S9